MREQATGLLPRDWDRHPLGEVPGCPLWAPSTNGPTLVDWETLQAVTPKQYIADPSYGLRWLNQNPYPACTLYSAAHAIQWTLAMSGRNVPELDPLTAWKEITGGRGGAALPTAATYLLEKGMPIRGGGRIKVVSMWDLPDAAAALSAISLGRGAWFGWYHPVGPHAQFALGVPSPKNPEVIGTWGEDNEPWRTVPYAGLVRGIQVFSAFAFNDVEVLDGKGDCN